MRRYIVTGAPGAGKTSLLLALRGRGHEVVREAATDVIATATECGADKHWEQSTFIDQIVALQSRRQAQPVPPGTDLQFYDRSPVCTLALSEYLGHPVPAVMAAEIDRIGRDRFYEREVFFVRDLGFVEPTQARRISYEQSLEFERVHVKTYLALGDDLVDVPRAEVAHRADLIEAAVKSWA